MNPYDDDEDEDDAPELSGRSLRPMPEAAKPAVRIPPKGDGMTSEKARIPNTDLPQLKLPRGAPTFKLRPGTTGLTPKRPTRSKIKKP